MTGLVLLPMVFLLGVSGVNSSPDIAVESLMRKDLPNDFPFQVFDAGFAVIRVKVRNPSSETLTLDPAELAAVSGKGKKFKRARPTDITPKLIRYYRGGGPPAVHGEARYGSPGYGGPGYVDRRPTIGIPGRAGHVNAGTGAALREILEKYEVAPVVLEPGAEYEGFFYLESKQSGRALAGSRIRWTTFEARVP